jgi:predicted metal-binding membrane protein
MALLFVGGLMNIWWILAITVYVAVEKLAPGGKRVSILTTRALMAAGIALSLRSAGVL